MDLGRYDKRLRKDSMFIRIILLLNIILLLYIILLYFVLLYHMYHILFSTYIIIQLFLSIFSRLCLELYMTNIVIFCIENM